MSESTWACVREQRQHLIDFLITLSPDEWNVPSLCRGWRVRDVVAHLTQGQEGVLNAGTFISILRARFNLNLAIEQGARERGDRLSPDELTDRLRAGLASRKTAPGSGATGILVDVFVHSSDITRPFGRPPLPIPVNCLRETLDYVVANRYLGGPRRSAGLTLRATDLDWTHGSGPAVEGTSEALILALTGRKDALRDLSGPGQESLAARI